MSTQDPQIKSEIIPRNVGPLLSDGHASRNAAGYFYAADRHRVNNAFANPPLRYTVVSTLTEEADA